MRHRLGVEVVAHDDRHLVGPQPVDRRQARGAARSCPPSRRGSARRRAPSRPPWRTARRPVRGARAAAPPAAAAWDGTSCRGWPARARPPGSGSESGCGTAPGDGLWTRSSSRRTGFWTAVMDMIGFTRGREEWPHSFAARGRIRAVLSKGVKHRAARSRSALGARVRGSGRSATRAWLRVGIARSPPRASARAPRPPAGPGGMPEHAHHVVAVDREIARRASAARRGEHALDARRASPRARPGSPAQRRCRARRRCAGRTGRRRAPTPTRRSQRRSAASLHSGR